MEVNKGTSTFEIEKMNFEPAISIKLPDSYTIHFSKPDSGSLFIERVYFSKGKDQAELRLQLLNSSMDGHYKASGDIENSRKLVRVLNLVPIGGSNDEFRFAKTEMFAIRLAQITYVCYGICLAQAVTDQNGQHLIQLFKSLRAHAELYDKASLSASYQTYLKAYITTTNDNINRDIQKFISGLLKLKSDRYLQEEVSSFANTLLVNMSNDCYIRPEPLHMVINRIL